MSLDPIIRGLFGAEPPPEVLAHNANVAAFHAERPNAWDLPAQVVRASRDEGKSIFGFPELSNRAEVRTIPGRGGDIGLRIFRPEQPVGIYLHIHGGGWVIGAAHHQDPLNEWLMDATGMVVVSVDYRLAPEDPYPAGPDDCETAAVWLANNAVTEFGTDRLAIGGESAGAHLSLVTLLRMRDRHDFAEFTAANLVYGAYDLTMTPSVRHYGDRGLILGTSITAWFADNFVPAELRTDPDVSPLYADVAGLPPAIFTVGTNDPLLDDTLFMHARYIAAGNEATINVVPGAIHAFDYFTDGPQTNDARELMHRFLQSPTRH